MNKNIKNSNIPKLRFPEFIDSGEWVEKIFGNELVFQTGFPFESSGFNKNQQGVRLIKNKDLRSDDNKVYYNKPFDEKYLVDHGDVLIGMDGDFTPCIWNKGKALLNQRVGKIKAKNKKQELFFYYLLIIHLKDIEEKTPRTTVKHLSHSVIESLKDFVPPTISEQQKIADCLSSLDEVIKTEKQRLEQLKRHKKALLQNLFPQQGEKVPKLRFSEFADIGEWEEKTLGEVGDFIGGGTPDTTNEKYWNGSILWYTPSEVKEGILGKSKRTISEEGLKNSSAKLLPKGTLLITTRATIGDIAIANEICTTNQGFQSLVVNESNINTFWYYWIQHHKKKLISKSSGSTFPEIGKNEIKNIVVYCPKKKEQEKIANCLWSLDETIQTQTERIEQLKKHKKGLLQNLFPRMRG